MFLFFFIVKKVFLKIKKTKKTKTNKQTNILNIPLLVSHLAISKTHLLNMAETFAKVIRLTDNGPI